jgi:SAM-dependent methyltransferase
MDENELLDEQLAYYRARAGEYDEWFLRTGRYDRGPEHRAWHPERAFDFVLFAFWMSHVPPSRFEAFWTFVHRALRPGGRVFFVDSLADQGATARDQAPLDDSGVARRRLNDGREFDIVKVYYEPASLERRLGTLGWAGWIRASGKHFLYGAVAPVA